MRQSFHFQKIAGTIKINIFKTSDFKNYQDVTALFIQNNLKTATDGIMNGDVKVQDLNGDGKLDIFAADRRLNLIWQKDVDGVYKRKPL